MQNRAAQSWRDVHLALTDHNWDACLLPDLYGYTTYHYCVYKSFGLEKDAALAQATFKRLITHLRGQPFNVWSAIQLDQICVVAWLSAQFTTDGLSNEQAPAILADLDQVLQQEALRLLHCHDLDSRSNFFRVVRYFGLRLLVPTTNSYLRSLLVLLSEQATDSVPCHSLDLLEQTQLGLTDGLAAELLVLIRLYKAGLKDNNIKLYVREGILRILRIKRDVNFLEQKYSVFPYQIHNLSRKATFSFELSWRRGDIGQAMLLYEAHGLLQDIEIAKIAELVGLNTLLRTTISSTLVASSSLYQGAAGLVYLYHKLYQLSRQEPYYKGRCFWLDQMHGWLRQELATGYYQQCESALLHGLVGVGLVLLSAVTEVELEWDVLLL